MALKTTLCENLRELLLHAHSRKLWVAEDCNSRGTYQDVSRFTLFKTYRYRNKIEAGILINDKARLSHALLKQKQQKKSVWKHHSIPETSMNLLTRKASKLNVHHIQLNRIAVRHIKPMGSWFSCINFIFLTMRYFSSNNYCNVPTTTPTAHIFTLAHLSLLPTLFQVGWTHNSKAQGGTAQ